jgi:hypothetical protein
VVSVLGVCRCTAGKIGNWIDGSITDAAILNVSLL